MPSFTLAFSSWVSQGLMGNGIVKEVCCTQRVPTSILLVLVLGRAHGSCLLEVLLFLVLRLNEHELGLKLVDLDGEMGHFPGVIDILKQSWDLVKDDVKHCRLHK